MTQDCWPGGGLEKLTFMIDEANQLKQPLTFLHYIPNGQNCVCC